MVEVWLDLDSVGHAVDESGHGGRAEGYSVVVKVFAIDALHHMTGVLFTCRLDVDGEGARPTLFLVGLVGPFKVVFGGHERARVVPIARATLPRSVPGIEPGVGKEILIPISIVASP